MEKLKPILKHKFWIIAGVVLMVTLVGWWLGTNAKAAYIQQRWDTLSALQVAPGSNTPNADYIAEIDKVIQILDQRQDALDKELYESQKSLHTWPENVAKYMDGKQFRDPASFNALQIYAREHYDEFKSMLAAIPRYTWDNMGNEYGMVHIEKNSDIPHVPPSTWKDTTPTSDAMWNTQEDIWLTRSILAAIKQVNIEAGATKISDAPIKQIFSLKFRGGTRQAPGTTPAPGGGDMGGSGEYGGGSAEYGSGEDMAASDNYSSGGEGMGGGQDFALNTALKVNLDPVFGPETIQAATTGEGSADPMAAQPMSGSQMGGGAKRRYVDDDPALPYRTRGFYIELLMDHTKLPDLQAALVSMPWPTELLLIQQASEQVDNIKPVMEETQERRPLPGRFNQGQPGAGRGGGFAPGGNRFAPGGNRFGAGRGGMSPQFGPRFQAGANRGGNFGPMGTRSGFGPMGVSDMGNMENMGNQGFGSGGNYQTDDSAFGKAMRDPFLTKVGIAGLMTIYRSPQEMAKSKGEEPAPVIQTELPMPAEGQTPEGEAPEGQIPDGQMPDGQVPEGQVPNQTTEPGAVPMPGQAAPAVPKTETNPAEPIPGNPPMPPVKETPAPTPETPAPMNSEADAPKPPSGDATPPNAPPQKNPQTPNS